MTLASFHPIRLAHLVKDVVRTGSFKLRSPHWPAFCKSLERAPGYNGCIACGSMEEVEWHHVESFHECPERELDATNVVPLCMDRRPGGTVRECHLNIGHKPPGAQHGDWRVNNPYVRFDAAAQLQKLKASKTVAQQLVREMKEA